MRIRKIVVQLFYQYYYIAIGLCTLLFFSLSAFSQSDISNSLPVQLNSYQQSHPTEKIFVHTDKNFYVAGEIIWFKIYTVDAADHKPVDVSKIAYIEILDLNNKAAMQAKVALDKGSGSGSFYLPASVNSGNYKFRAYTAWMKNSTPDFYFEKPLTIVNTFKPLNVPAAKDTAAVTIHFFPEGGNMVNGIQCKVAFKIEGPYGKGINSAGIIVNEQNDTVLRFQPLKFGMGNFSFTPSHHTYKAILKSEDGRTITQALPSVYPQGYVMNVTEAPPNDIKVTIQSNTGDQAAVFLLIHSNEVVKTAEQKAIANGAATFTIDKNKLGDGISVLTVFNNDKQPVCERLYFKAPQQKLWIDAKTDAAQYGTRQKVNLSVTTKDEQQQFMPADLSFAVYKLDSLQSLDQNNILNYLWLTSDLKGKIESPDYYFSNDKEAQEAADNLMLTQGWRRFNWNDISGNKTFTPSFLPEQYGHFITGKVINNLTGMPAAGVQTYLSIPGTHLQFYQSKSDSQGNIYFNVQNFYGPNEIIVQTNEQQDSIYRIDMTTPFSSRFSSTPLPLLNVSETAQQALNQHNISTQVQNTYAVKMLEQYALPPVDSLPFYGQPTKRYLLDDYTRFPTMEEVLREYVFEVGVRKRGGSFHLPVLKVEDKGFYNEDPLILLDGIPVFKADKIVSYDPLKVRKLEVVASKYFYGPLVYGGVISFTTYNGNYEDFSLDPKAMIIDYEGLQLKREFYSPVYETEQQIKSRLPDFRNVLAWLPDMAVNAQGKGQFHFYTSDVKGKYVAVLQGLSTDGRAGYQYISFEVK